MAKQGGDFDSDAAVRFRITLFLIKVISKDIRY
jgi:hypothetical protein